MTNENNREASRDALVLMSTALMHLIRYMGDEADHSPAKAARVLESITTLSGLDGETQAMIRSMAARCRELDGGVPGPCRWTARDRQCAGNTA